MGTQPGAAAGTLLAERWRLDAPIGQGTFGSVWRGVDTTTHEPVAVKLLHSAYAANRKILGRFVQEAEIQAGLSHPAVVSVLAWRLEPVPFLVMPLVDGESLHQRCRRWSEDGVVPSLSGVGWLVDQIGAAATAAHGAGVLHRDLKPRNVLVHRPGTRPFVKVLDFGVAKLLEGGQLPATTVGRVMGSVLYLAPEQVTAPVAPTVAVDQFALASIAFELLTGRRAWARDFDGRPLPFRIPVDRRGDNRQMSVLERIVDGPRPSVLEHRPEVGLAVDEALRRGLDADPDRRFPDVQSFVGALREGLELARRERGMAAVDEAEPLTLVPSGLRPSVGGVDLPDAALESTPPRAQPKSSRD